MRHQPRPQRRLYDEAVRSVLVVLGEASDRICDKRLKPLVPLLVEAMERHGHLRLEAASALRRSIPIFNDWNDPPPGFFEANLVAHCGPRTAGSYVQMLVRTDIVTGWTECAPLVVRQQQLLTTILSEVQNLLPFALLGFDTDNDSVFMNETVRDYCRSRLGGRLWTSGL